VFLVIQVAAAIIHNEEDQILIARRKQGKSQAGLWEFPGGKIEQDESIADCLQRELQEEMGIRIFPYESFGMNEHNYGEVTIQLMAWKARYLEGVIDLVDHDEYRWVFPAQLDQFIFAPADIPFVERLMMESKPI
jgi:8-oxo-dGTP diphosphatase